MSASYTDCNPPMSNQRHPYSKAFHHAYSPCSKNGTSTRTTRIP